MEGEEEEKGNEGILVDYCGEFVEGLSIGF